MRYLATIWTILTETPDAVGPVAATVLGPGRTLQPAKAHDATVAAAHAAATCCQRQRRFHSKPGKMVMATVCAPHPGQHVSRRAHLGLGGSTQNGTHE